jgi:hypothetical protein
MGWIPDWADTIAFNAWKGEAAWFDTGKAIIDQRTEECLTHFKGHVLTGMLLTKLCMVRLTHLRMDTDFVALGGSTEHLRL